MRKTTMSRRKRETSADYKKRHAEVEKNRRNRDPEKRRENDRAYYWKNRAKLIARQKEDYKKHKDRRKAYSMRPDVREAGNAWRRAAAKLLRHCPHCLGHVTVSAWTQRIKNEQLSTKSTTSDKRTRAAKSGQRNHGANNNRQRVARSSSPSRRPTASAKRTNRRKARGK